MKLQLVSFHYYIYHLLSNWLETKDYSICPCTILHVWLSWYIFSIFSQLRHCKKIMKHTVGWEVADCSYSKWVIGLGRWEIYPAWPVECRERGERSSPEYSTLSLHLPLTFLGQSHLASSVYYNARTVSITFLLLDKYKRYKNKTIPI